MKKVLVSGANGFVGTALCKELCSQGVSVVAIVRDMQHNVEDIINLPGLRIISCDLSKYSELDNLIQDRDIDVFYHLAWVGTAGPLRGDYDVQINNVRYACDAIELCSKLRCKRFVFASSIMEYEIMATMETETTPSVNTLYSSAKVAADFMARTIAGSLGIEYIRAVISNIYGPGEVSSRLINTSLRKMLKGEHCSFSPGEQVYDFIYITDAAKSFVAIGEKGIKNRTYYIGSLNPKPLKYFLIEMKNQVSSNIEIGLGEISFSGISLTYDEFDIYAVKKDTGFEPSIDFATGIKNTISWIKENDNGKL